MIYSMKKNCLLLWAFLCSFSIFVSCEKDDPAWKNIPPTFENTAITVNNTTVGGSADFVATGENSGILTLRNVISGYSDAVKIDVVLKEESENSFTFTGETSLDNPKTKDNAVPEPWMAIKATGTIRTDATGKYGLTVNLTTSGWNEISNIYTGDSLSLKINATKWGNPAPVELIASSNSEATLVFENLYELGKDVEVPVTYSYDGTAKYDFDGYMEKEPGLLITVHATLTAGKLDIELTTSGWKKLYYNRYSGASLKMTYNGKEDTDQVCSISLFDPSSPTDAEISIHGPFLPMNDDDDDIIVIPVKMEEDAATGTYSFKGNTENDKYKFKASAEGTITSDGVMTIAFDYEITSDLVGVWGVKMNGPMGDVIFQYQGADIQIPDSVYNYVPENLKQMIPQTIPATMVNQMGNALLGQYAPQLRKLEFKSNGYIDATVIKVNESEETLADDILQYYVCGDQLFVFPNLVKLMGDMGMMSASNRTATKAWDANNLFMTGIPLTFNVNENATVTLETETIIGVVGFVKTLLPLLGMLMPDLAPSMPMLNAVMDYLTNPEGGVLPNTQVLRAGLTLERK